MRVRNRTTAHLLPSTEDEVVATSLFGDEHQGMRSSPETQSLPRVLLVEDDDALRLVASEALALAGFEVAAVESAESAGDALAAADGLVTDGHLPGMGGIELADHARRVRPGMPVVVISADPAVGVASAARGLPFLAKPVAFDELARTLRALIEASSASVEGPGDPTT